MEFGLWLAGRRHVREFGVNTLMIGVCNIIDLSFNYDLIAFSRSFVVHFALKQISYKKREKFLIQLCS